MRRRWPPGVPLEGHFLPLLSVGVAGCHDGRILGAGVGRREAGQEPRLPPLACTPPPRVNLPPLELEPEQDSEKNALSLRRSIPQWSPRDPKSLRHKWPATSSASAAGHQEEGFAAVNRLPYLKLPLRRKHNLCARRYDQTPFLLHLSSRWSLRGLKSRRHDLPGTSSTSAAGYQQAQLAAEMYGSTGFASKPVKSVVTSSRSSATIMDKGYYIGRTNGSIHGGRTHSSNAAPRIATVGSIREFRVTSNMSMRCFSTANPYQDFTPPTLEAANLMSPIQERPIRTAPFKIETDGEPFVIRVNSDKEICKNFLATQMRKVFDHYETALKVRGLISPFSLKDQKSKGLHSAYKGIVKNVVYLTAYDFSVNISDMPKKSRREFLDFLCDERVIVTRDWDTMSTSVTQTYHDLGTKRPRDGSFLYKGECDASYDDPEEEGEGEKKNQGKARIAMILWHEDQVVWCEVLKDIPCKNSTEAEALAMCLLLKRAIQLGILELEVCTDCFLVDRVIRGEHVYTDKDKDAELFDLLRALRGNFVELICRWTPREGLTFVDGLSKLDQSFRRKRTLDVVSRKVTRGSNAESVLSFWGPILSGVPIFSVKEKGCSLRNIAMKNIQYPEECLKFHSVCHHAVGGDEQDKVNALWHIIRALKPSEVSIRMKSNESVERIQEVFGSECNDTIVADEGSCTLGLALDDDELFQRELMGRNACKCLNVIWDAELFDDQPLPSFTVVFAAPHEMNMVDKLEEFSPVSIASFSNPRE